MLLYISIHIQATYNDLPLTLKYHKEGI